MKKLLLLALLITSQLVSGQKLKIDWGKSLTSETKYFDPKIIGEDKDYLYAYNLDGDEITLEKIEKKKMKRKYSKVLELPSKGKQDYDFEKISFFGDKYVLFASTYIRKKKEMQLMAFTIDAKTGKYKDEVEIFSREVEKKRRRGYFDVYLSRDSDLLLVHGAAYYKKLKHTKEQFKLLDSDLNVVLERSQILDGEGVVAKNFIVDEEGSVYFVRGGSEVVVYDANQDYEEWSQQIELEEMEVGAFITDMVLALNKENDIVLTGSYYTTDAAKTNENKRRRDRKEGDVQVEGMFFMKIDEISKETTVSRLSRFNKDFLDQFRSKRDIKKGRDAEVNSIYDGSQVFFKDDGGIVLVTERQFSNYTTNTNGATVGERFYFLDLISFNFAPDGEMLWANRIPKSQLFWWQQTSGGFNYGSYGVGWFVVPYYRLNHYSYLGGLSEGKLYLIFNDHKKNRVRKLDSDKLNTMSNVKKSVPTVVTIDLETGKKSKKVDMGLLSGRVRLKPSTSYQSSQKDPLYLLSAHKKQYKYGKIDFTQVGNSKRKSRRR